jgi:hypothetical protein
MKNFEEIDNFILYHTIDNIHAINKQIKLHKKFRKMHGLFNEPIYQKINTYDELCELFMFAFREKIRSDIKSQFSQYNLSVLNTLLHRFENICPEKPMSIAKLVSKTSTTQVDTKNSI